MQRFRFLAAPLAASFEPEEVNFRHDIVLHIAAKDDGSVTFDIVEDQTVVVLSYNVAAGIARSFGEAFVEAADNATDALSEHFRTTR